MQETPLDFMQIVAWRKEVDTPTAETGSNAVARSNGMLAHTLHTVSGTLLFNPKVN